MFVGGTTGSTTGGIKLRRLAILLESVRWRLRRRHRLGRPRPQATAWARPVRRKTPGRSNTHSSVTSDWAALTASVLPEDRARCARAGMDDYLPKPFRQAQMEKMLERWTTEEHTDAAPPMASDQDPLGNPDGFLDRLDELESTTDPEMFSELCGLFVGGGKTYLDELSSAVRDADLGTARKSAHAFKGMSMNFRAGGLAEICGLMEDAATSGDTNLLPELLERLSMRFGEARRQVEARRSVSSSPSQYIA